jgi:hypothetical protein
MTVLDELGLAEAALDALMTDRPELGVRALETLLLLSRCQRASPASGSRRPVGTRRRSPPRAIGFRVVVAADGNQQRARRYRLPCIDNECTPRRHGRERAAALATPAETRERPLFGRSAVIPRREPTGAVADPSDHVRRHADSYRRPRAGSVARTHREWPRAGGYECGGQSARREPTTR